MKRTRLAYAADAIGLERIIMRSSPGRRGTTSFPCATQALPVAAMGFTIANWPSEWRLSAAWEDLFLPGGPTGWLDRVAARSRQRPGPGRRARERAHAALLLPNAYERIVVYRDALEIASGHRRRMDSIFQVDRPDGPEWTKDERTGRLVPLAWTKNNYNHWVKRVFNPAREVAARAPTDRPTREDGVLDRRHTGDLGAALHSTLGDGSPRDEPPSRGRLVRA